MQGWFNPDDWLDVVDHLLLVFGAIMVAAIPSWLSMRNHKSLLEVKEQVKNGHTGSNLRDDLDRAIAAIDNISHDITSLRRDLNDEEERRRAHVKDLEDQLARRITELNRRLS